MKKTFANNAETMQKKKTQPNQDNLWKWFHWKQQCYEPI